MKRLLNTLYVTKEDAWLHKDGTNVVVDAGDAELGRAPIHMLGAIVCFGRIGASPALLGHCADHGVAVTFLTPEGRFLARMEGPHTGNVLLRRAQHRASAERAAALPVARAVVAAKLANQRQVLQRALRDHGADGEIEAASRRLANAARRALVTEDFDQVQGLEGDGANAYFSVFRRLIRRDEPELTFRGRSRRPPLDAPNALLSFLYTLLASDCRAAAETVGLDPQMGFLHRDRPGRAGLALDLMEEFRAPIADRLMLTLFNRGQLGPKDFRFVDGGAVLLADDARKTVLAAYQTRKRQEIRHPFLGETIHLGLAPHIQAQLLTRHLRGDLDAYPAFVWS
ncbi:MAG: type I-C CRISPR-associated endonuclease Cas1 [Rhodospirillaceae bacterium]|nr:type I-C CRISPR-associated endonuclease Cas1 [Rhodospirillaceae bacterium]